jgi:hypothetical protein
MRLPKEQIPVVLDIPGATARHLPDFGTASGVFGAEYFSLGAGTDITPLLEGLEGDLCQAPHWGYLIAGEVVVTYADGSSVASSAATSSTGRPGTRSGSGTTRRSSCSAHSTSTSR